MDLKSLKALLKVLRDNGVVSYDTADLKLTLSDLPVDKSSPSSAIPEDYVKPTDEELLYYSAVPTIPASE